jgi:hypothetical protein
MYSSIYRVCPNIGSGTDFDNRRGAMSWQWSAVNRSYAFLPDPSVPDPRDKDPDDAPETPLDEPRPPRIQDPPPQPQEKGPYTVRTQGW